MAQKFDVHPNRITAWKAQLVDGAAEVFGSEPKEGLAAPAIDVRALHAEIGELTLTDVLIGAQGRAPRKISYHVDNERETSRQPLVTGIA